MKRPFLLTCAAVFNGISTLAFLPTVAVCLLPMKSRLFWPVTIVLFPLTIPLLGLWAVAQVISSLCAFIFYQQIGTRASIQAEGLQLNLGVIPRFIAWHDIDSVRRVYERFFPDYQTRFRDNSAYQVMLKSGEDLYIDFVDEVALRSKTIEHGIATEGFDSRLSAYEFEPATKSEGDESVSLVR